MTSAKRKAHVARLLRAVDGVGPAALVAAVKAAPLDNPLSAAGLVRAAIAGFELTPAGRQFLERASR